MDKFLELAQLPSCLLAISAMEKRPAWYSQLRSNALRNFEIREQIWQELTDVIKEVKEADFRLSLSFSAQPASSQISRSLVLCTTWSSNEQCCVSFWQNDSQNRLRISIIGLYDDGISDEYVDLPGFILEQEVEAEVVIERKSIELAVVVNGIDVYRKNRSNPKAVTFSLAATQDSLRSAFNGGLKFLRFESGGSHWEAASDLLQVGEIYPINFSIPKIWNASRWTSIGVDDFEFFISFDLQEQDSEVIIFSSSDQEGTISIGWNGETKESFISFKLFEGDSWIFTSARLMELGEHSLRVSRIGQIGQIEVDGEIVQTWGGEIPLAVFASSNPQSKFNGTISRLYFKNLTTNKVIWQASLSELNVELPLYPTPVQTSIGLSPAQNAGLLKLVNIKTDSGRFEIQNPNLPARIQTKLDFRQRERAFTVIGKAYFPWFANDQNAHFYPIAQQGDAKAAFGGNKVFGLYALVDYRSYPVVYELVFTVGLSNELQREISMALTASFFNKEHSVAAAFIPLLGSSFKLQLFTDGALSAEQTFENTISQLGSGAAENSEGCNPDGIYAFNCAYYGYFTPGYELDHCLIFDRALDAGEIAAISEKSMQINSLLDEKPKFTWVIPD